MAEEKTPEATIALLTAKAKNGDSFRVKLSRKATAGGPSLQICTLAGATLDHIANPETWIPRLGGGGHYQLTIFHQNDPMPTGVPLPIQIQGSPIEIDPRVVQSENWNGPSEMIYPTLDDKTSAGQQARPLFQVPSVANPLSPAPPTLGPGGGNQLTAPPQSPFGQQPTESVADLRNQLAQAREQLNFERTQFANKEHALALEGLKRDFEARLATVTGSTVTKTPENPLASLAPLIAAMTPVLTSLVQSSKEAREAEQRRQEQQNQQFQALLLQLLNKPAVDPVFQQTMERMVTEIKASKQSPESDTMAAMSKAMQSMVGTSMELFHAAAELGNGGQPKEPVGLMVAKEIAKAFAMFGKATPARPPPGRPPQRQLPPPAQRPAPRPANVQVQPPPATAPTSPPPPAPEPQKAAQAFADLPTDAKKDPDPVGAVDQLEDMVRAYADPKSVVDLFFNSLNDPQMQAELAAVNGEWQEMFAKRLMDFFVDGGEPAAAYVAQIMELVNARGAELGVMESEEDEEDADEDEVEEAETSGDEESEEDDSSDESEEVAD